jgi:hypothetical protein
MRRGQSTERDADTIDDRSDMSRPIVIATLAVIIAVSLALIAAEGLALFDPGDDPNPFGSVRSRWMSGTFLLLGSIALITSVAGLFKVLKGREPDDPLQRVG